MQFMRKNNGVASALIRYVLLLLVLFLVLANSGSAWAAELTIPIQPSGGHTIPLKTLLKPGSVDYATGASTRSVHSWDMPISTEILRLLGLDEEDSADDSSSTVEQYLNQLISNQLTILQGQNGLTVSNSLTQIVRQEQVVGQPVTLPATPIIEYPAPVTNLTLGSQTTGDYLSGLAVGNGIAIGGTSGEGWLATVGLGDLSANWLQSQAHDLILNNVDSQLQILGSDGAAFATLDAGPLLTDTTYLLAGPAGTVLTTGNYLSHTADLLTGVLLETDNLAGLTDLGLARSNLDLGTIATQSIDGFFQTANNLAELADLSAARDNLGLGSAALEASADLVHKASNLAGLADVGTARDNLGLGSLATQSIASVLQTSGNLSDLTNTANARSHLGLGSVATESSSSFLRVADNLEDILDPTAARTNLGLGSLATESIANVLQSSGNLEELTDSVSARSNLGLGSVATEDSDDFLRVVDNLSDLGDPNAARTSLGLGSSATQSMSSFLQVANNLSDLANPTLARGSLGLGTIATQSTNSFIQTANDLSDVANPGNARSNLGLGTVATEAVTTFLRSSNNLSDLADVATGRATLGLGTLATQNASAVSLTGGTLDGVVIGGSNAASGIFTSLNSSGNSTLGSAGNLTLGHGAGTVQINSNGLDLSTAGALSGVTGYDQSAGNFTMSGSGTLSTGTGTISLNGNTTVASNKTLAITTSDGLTVGGNIIPQTVTIAIPVTASLLDQVAFVADASYQLAAVRCVYSAAASTGTIQVTVDTGTTAPGGGIDQLASALSLNGTINTVVNGVLVGSPTTILAGNKVSIDMSGLMLGLFGTCTLTLKRV